MIRLLQRFEGFALAEDKQLPPPWKLGPESTHPPKRGMFGPGWPGSKRKAVERIWPGNNIVLHVKANHAVTPFHVCVAEIVPREGCGSESRRLTDLGRDKLSNLFLPSSIKDSGRCNVGYTRDVYLWTPMIQQLFGLRTRQGDIFMIGMIHPGVHL